MVVTQKASRFYSQVFSSFQAQLQSDSSPQSKATAKEAVLKFHEEIENKTDSGFESVLN